MPSNEVVKLAPDARPPLSLAQTTLPQDPVQATHATTINATYPTTMLSGNTARAATISPGYPPNVFDHAPLAVPEYWTAPENNPTQMPYDMAGQHAHDTYRAWSSDSAPPAPQSFTSEMPAHDGRPLDSAPPVHQSFTTAMPASDGMWPPGSAPPVHQSFTTAMPVNDGMWPLDSAPPAHQSFVEPRGRPSAH
jgi:hypothetical protein